MRNLCNSFGVTIFTDIMARIVAKKYITDLKANKRSIILATVKVCYSLFDRSIIMRVPTATQRTAAISYLGFDFSPKHFVAIMILKMIPVPPLHAISVSSQNYNAMKRPIVPTITKNNPPAPLHVHRTAF